MPGGAELSPFDYVLERGVFAVLRLDAPDRAVPLAEAIAAGGVRGIEFTMTTPQALTLLAPARTRLEGRALVGMGTVTDGQQAREAVAAGAAFLVTPTLSWEVVEVAQERGVPVMIGAFSPTEVLAAWRAGADLVKVFPARMGGPAYLRDLLAPLPDLRLVPSGGVDVESAPAYIRAGAAGVAVGGALVDRALVARGAWAEITARAQALVEAVARARTEGAGAGVGGT